MFEKEKKLVVVYDENILSSVLAAAAAASIKELIVVERKTLVPKADNYLWINVIPTLRNFSFSKDEVVKTSNTIIAPNGSHVNENMIRNASFFNPEETIGITDSYGERTIVEKTMDYFVEDCNMFLGLINIERNFYKKETCYEELCMASLNFSEALDCLKRKLLFQYIPFSPKALEDGMEVFEKLKAEAYNAINKRSSYSVMEQIDYKGERLSQKVYTFYEQTNWWFIKRKFEVERLSYGRNLTFGSSGVVIYSDFTHRNEFRGIDSVFVK